MKLQLFGSVFAACIGTLCFSAPACADQPSGWTRIESHFSPPPEYAGKFGTYRSPLLFDDGTTVKTPQDWQRRRRQILDYWHHVMGAWPELIERPMVETLDTGRREDFTQHKVRVEIAKGQVADGYLLVPDGQGPFPAVFVPFYEPETSTGQNDKKLRAFAYDLTRRGFVTLSIGSPGGDARKPDTAGNVLQPLSYLAYVAANCCNALGAMAQVDPKRIGIVGHSYGSKWAMFASCLYDKFAAAAWSDGGVVWDESRPNVNYWEPWYLGLDPARPNRKPGVITSDNPRTGAYKTLVETGHDLHELHALMAPRPFLVSGGSEDPPERWLALNHAVAVNNLLGQAKRVGMTNRPAHDPTPESNEIIYLFFEHFLKADPPQKSQALSKDQAAATRKALWDEHEKSIRSQRQKEWDEKSITLGDQTMKWKARTFGTRPKDGWDLYISMHGGGNAPARVNDQQWENQARLYEPGNCLYVAPRAPTNTWNLWHEAHIDELFDRLLEDAFVIGEVNPDRVYLMGYSAGGDGVYQLAPRFADRFAAAAMMAGHPNDASPLGLRNIGFAVHVGADDNGYNRNKVAAEWKQKLADLKAADPAGYAHDVQLRSGRGHWMNGEDRVALDWMAKFTRDPLPEKVVWRQSTVTHDRFYWLAVPKDQTRAGQVVVVSREGQEVRIEQAEGVKTLTVLLNDTMLDLDKEVRVTKDGRELFRGVVPRTRESLQRTLADRGDPRLMFDASVTVAF